MRTSHSLIFVAFMPLLLCFGCMSPQEQTDVLAALVKESQAESNAILFIQPAAIEFYRKHARWPTTLDELRGIGDSWKTAPDFSMFERVSLVPTASESLQVSLVRRGRLPVTFELHAPIPEKPNKAPEPTSGSVTPRAFVPGVEVKQRNQSCHQARVAPAPAVAHL